MSPRIVVDASVVIGWALGEPETFRRAQRVLAALATSRALVPAIWQAEVANVLVVEERQHRIDGDFMNVFVEHLRQLPFEVDAAAATEAFDRVMPIARRHQLSVYDATYLELAMREKAPLATFDRALTDAARRDGVGLFEGLTEG